MCAYLVDLIHTERTEPQEKRSERDSVWVNSSEGGGYNAFSLAVAQQNHTLKAIMLRVQEKQNIQDTRTVQTQSYQPFWLRQSRRQGVFFWKGETVCSNVCMLCWVWGRAEAGILLPCCSAIGHYGSGLGVAYSPKHLIPGIYRTGDTHCPYIITTWNWTKLR